jgi:serine/threonine protein kinase
VQPQRGVISLMLPRLSGHSQRQLLGRANRLILDTCNAREVLGELEPRDGDDSYQVHLDIKPSNIVVPAGEPQVIDFGVARCPVPERQWTTQRDIGRQGDFVYQAPAYDERRPAAVGRSAAKPYMAVPSIPAFGADDHRWELPPDAIWPFVIRSCCDGSTPGLSADIVGDAQTVGAQVWSVGTEPRSLRVNRWSTVVRLTVTIRDRQLVSDYREGLRRFLSALLALLLVVLAMVLAALSHQPQAPMFLLVMLRSIRRYGHRGDSDGHSLLGCNATGRSKGVFRLAA